MINSTDISKYFQFPKPAENRLCYGGIHTTNVNSPTLYEYVHAHETFLIVKYVGKLQYTYFQLNARLFVGPLDLVPRAPTASFLFDFIFKDPGTLFEWLK